MLTRLDRGSSCLWVLDLHGVDKELLITDRDQHGGLMAHGLINKCGDHLTSSGGFELTEPVAEQVDPIRMNCTDGKSNHEAILPEQSTLDH